MRPLRSRGIAMAKNVLGSVAFSVAVPTGSRGNNTTDVNCAAINMVGFKGAVAVIEMGSITTNGTVAFNWEHSESGTSGWADVGTTESIGSNDDNDIVVMEIAEGEYTRPYLRLQINKSSAASTLRSGIYQRYGATHQPVTGAVAGTSGTVTVHANLDAP